MAVLTSNPAHQERQMRAAEKALADAWDEALEIGCMEHGGFRHLAEAVLDALRLIESEQVVA